MSHVSREEREVVEREFERAGVSEEVDECWWWAEEVAKYRKTGRCSSVMFSTVEFLPVISKLLEALEALRADH